MSPIEKYLDWKSKHDEDYQYDEIHDFANGLSRGELQCVFEIALASEKDALEAGLYKDAYRSIE